MVDEVRGIARGQPTINETEAAANLKAQKGKNADTDQDHVTQDEDLYTEIKKQTLSLKNKKASLWRVSHIKALHDLIKNIIEQKKQEAKKIDRSNDFAIDQAANQARLQLRKLIGILNPPSEIAEGDEMQELMELLWPKSMSRKGNTFAKGSGLKGNVRGEVQKALINDAVLKASKRAGAKMQQQLQGQNPNSSQFAKMSFEHMARALKRKRKALKRGKIVNEDGELEEMTDDERRERRRELQELMEIFSYTALETMKIMREEIAPTWKPDQQPWLLAEADKQVFDILLAGADEDMLKETQAWDDIQDLRKGDAVFTLRASDKLTEAAARRK